VPKFAAIITYQNRDALLAVRPRHREYLRALVTQGKLHESGPFADDSGALIIYEANDEQEARSLLAADPITDAGVIASTDMREWTRVIPG
jgi:uncharacterized protein YciI